jgi:putative membrane protein
MRRWPGWVYATGTEPDPRFTFANERTFLAWIRTALALVSAGVVLDVVDLPLADAAERFIALLLVLLGLACALGSWARWTRAERALRRQEPLPSSPFAALLAAGVVIICIVLLASI